MDYISKTKQDPIEGIVFYKDANTSEHLFLSQQEIDFDEVSQGFIDADNDIIFKKTKLKKFPLNSKYKEISSLKCSIQQNLKCITMHDSIAFK